MRWNVEHHLDQPELLYTYNRQLLLNNPEIMGSSIAMEPYYYRDKGKLFMAYSYRTAHGDTSIVESDHYGSRPYSEQKWYTIPKDQNRATWVKPIEHDETSRSITCYSVPIRDADRRVVGILSVDISLDSLTNAINKTKPFPNSYCTMLGRQGTFIIHPDSVRLHNQTVYDVLKERPDPELASLVASMMAGETGYRNVTIDGCDSYVFYKPFKSESWCAAIVCPTSEIMAANNRLLSVTLFIAAIGLVALLFFCLFLCFAALRGRTDSCQCFGQLANMTPTLSLLKNAVLVIMTLAALRLQGKQSRKRTWLAAVLTAAALATPFIVSVPDSWMFGSSHERYNREALKDVECGDRETDRLVAFVTPGCPYCRMTRQKLDAMAVRHNITDEAIIYIEPKDIGDSLFLTVTYGARPLVLLMHGDSVMATYHYRNINERQIVKALKK
jgi:hypothetical protein